jgi:putative DNA methylase
MATDDIRLIEDYLPIAAISAVASGEPRSKGHISTLHIWRARRPLLACRAAVYAALVPASQFAPHRASDSNKRTSLGRAHSAKFVERLCTYPGDPAVIIQAGKHLADAHASRRGPSSSSSDRPRVLDLFAGGGAIPLEAARLGCETYAVELNPVAHLIELCTTTFPQKFGSELAEDVDKWGHRVLSETKQAVSDVLSIVRRSSSTRTLSGDSTYQDLSVVAHYWTRTVRCPNAQCHGTVPLYRQTWLRKKESGFVALRAIPDLQKKAVRFQVVKSQSEDGLGFDPGEGSEGSATTCPFCAAAVPGRYVREYGDTRGFGQQLMCVITLNPEGPGKLFLVDPALADGEEALQAMAEVRANQIEHELGNSSLDEAVPPTGNAGLATGNSYLYGIRTFRQMFLPRQRLILLTMAREIQRAYRTMIDGGMALERAAAVTTYLGIWLSRLTDRCNTLARWHNARETIESLTSMKRFAMMWDFPEVNLFGGASGDAIGNLDFITAAIRQEGAFRNATTCIRGSATEIAFPDEYFDAVITDPPYYDNESYSELSDVCYVWLRPTLAFLYPDHFASPLTPKKKECVAAAYRQGGKVAAKQYYEDCLFRALKQSHRVLKSDGILVLVYAHKTTLGWSTLVDAIRRAGFEVKEAWPLDTETKARVAHRGDAALASSIFLVARRRSAASRVGSYEDEVQPQLKEIVSERVGALWDMGIAGADLVIACVGAGLRAFTRYGKVEYANGEEVPAKTFLAEVEGAVLDTMLARILGRATSNVSAIDPASRFYVLWRYVYRVAEIDAGEAIVFTYAQHVELDGSTGLSAGKNALVEKKKATYRARDYSERGANEKLGHVDDDGRPAPMIDVLHRVLWLLENSPLKLTAYLNESRPDRERLRVLAQALAGAALSGTSVEEAERLVGTTPAEQGALGKLLANWRSLIDSAVESKEERADRKTGQKRLDLK